MKYISPNVKIKHRVIQPAKNEVTGDVIQTKVASNSYRDNFDAIFGTKPSNSENLPINDNQSK
jgi:hypothetical protein